MRAAWTYPLDGNNFPATAPGASRGPYSNPTDPQARLAHSFKVALVDIF